MIVRKINVITLDSEDTKRVTLKTIDQKRNHHITITKDDDHTLVINDSQAEGCHLLWPYIPGNLQ